AAFGFLSNCTSTRTGVAGFVTLKSGDTEPAKALAVSKTKERVSRSGLFISRSQRTLCIRRAIRKRLIRKGRRFAERGQTVFVRQIVPGRSKGDGERGEIGRRSGSGRLVHLLGQVHATIRLGEEPLGVGPVLRTKGGADADIQQPFPADRQPGVDH